MSTGWSRTASCISSDANLCRGMPSCNCAGPQHCTFPLLLPLSVPTYLIHVPDVWLVSDGTARHMPRQHDVAHDRITGCSFQAYQPLRECSCSSSAYILVLEAGSCTPHAGVKNCLVKLPEGRIIISVLHDFRSPVRSCMKSSHLGASETCSTPTGPRPPREALPEIHFPRGETLSSLHGVERGFKRIGKVHAITHQSSVFVRPAAPAVSPSSQPLNPQQQPPKSHTQHIHTLQRRATRHIHQYITCDRC